MATMASSPSSTKSEYTNHLLLDFGGVVLKSPFELRNDASKTLGPVSWAGPFDPSTDPEYVRWQSSKITERVYGLRS